MRAFDFKWYGTYAAVARKISPFVNLAIKKMDIAKSTVKTHTSPNLKPRDSTKYNVVIDPTRTMMARIVQITVTKKSIAVSE